LKTIHRYIILVMICVTCSLALTFITYFYSYANASDYGWVWSLNRGWPLSWAVEMHAGVLEFPLPAFYPFNFQALNFSLDLVFWGIVLLLPSSLYLYQKSSQSVHTASAFRSPRTLVGILAVASVVLVLDIPIAFLVRSYISVPLGIWTPYLANGTDYRPIKGIFGDLLFLEGIVALAIGLSAIGAGVIPIGGHARRDPETRQKLREKTSSGIGASVIGAIFFGVALLVVFLPL
jgi:hypothetical protein